MKTFKEWNLQEMTISPFYQSKGVFNPYYTLIISDSDVREKTGLTGELRYKCVVNPKGTEVKRLGNGKYYFQIEADGVETEHYVTSTAKNVKAHHGAKTRKNSTASSNVNEYMSLYFLQHPEFNDYDSWLDQIMAKTGPSGVLYADGKPVTYEDIKQLLDEDETAERDVIIGKNNAAAVKKDLGRKGWKNLYWVPRGKPGNIAAMNPSDIIIQLNDGSYVGYSNKIATGTDATPKFNTSISAFYSKLNDTKQLNQVQNFIDKAWNDAAKSVPASKKNATAALANFDITSEKYSESSSKVAFAKIAKEFQKDKLKFYEKDFYHPFRNNCIASFMKHLSKVNNLIYFLNTIGFYTYPDPNATPCPYKLLIGDVSSSTIKDVSSNEDQKALVFCKDQSKFKSIQTSYKAGQQSFSLSFKYEGKDVTVPMTMRTRAAGGWSGKSLYINTAGIKMI